MSTASIAIIQERVNEEIKNGSIIDVYRLAATLRQACPDLGMDQIAHIVSRAVIQSRGSAVWERKQT